MTRAATRSPRPGGPGSGGGTTFNRSRASARPFDQSNRERGNWPSRTASGGAPGRPASPARGARPRPYAQGESFDSQRTGQAPDGAVRLTPVPTAVRLTTVGTVVRLTLVGTDGAKSGRGVLSLAGRALVARGLGADQVETSSSGGPTSSGVPTGTGATVPEGSQGSRGAAQRLAARTRATVPEVFRGRRGAAQRLPAGTPEREARLAGSPVGKAQAHGAAPVRRPPLAGAPETAERAAGVATGRTVVVGRTAVTLVGTSATTRGDQPRVVRCPRVGAALLVTVSANWITTAGRRLRFGPELKSGRAHSRGGP